jgi:uncharacterized coiled-coil DUF342 family protein
MRRTPNIYSRGYLGIIVFTILAFCLYYCASLPNSNPKTALALQSSFSGAFDLATIQQKPEYATKISVATKPPQGVLDWMGWGSYFIFIGIVLAIPVVIGLLLWNCMCWYCCCRVCCGNCGGTPRVGGYTKRDRYIMAIPYLIILVFLTVVGVLGCVFSLLFVGGIKILTKEGYTLFDDMLGRVDRVQDTMNNVSTSVNNIFTATKTAISGLFKFGPILDQISNNLDETTTELDKMRDNLDSMSRSVETIKEKTLALKQVNDLKDLVPDVNEIPDPAGANSATLNQFRNTADDFKTELNTVKSTINDGMQTDEGAVNELIDKGNSSIEQITGMAQGVVDNVVSMIEQYLGTKAKRDEIYKYVELSLDILIGVVCAFYGLLFLFYLMGLGATLCTNSCGNCILHTIGAFTHIAVLVCFILGGFQIASFLVVNDICTEHERYIVSLENELNMDFELPLNLSISKAVIDLLNCDGNKTALDAIGLSLDNYNVTALIDETLEQIRPQFDAFNITGVTDEIKSQIEAFSNIGDNFDFNYTEKIEEYNNRIDDDVKPAAEEMQEPEKTESLENIDIIKDSTGDISSNLTEIETALDNVKQIPDEIIGHIDEMNELSKDTRSNISALIDLTSGIVHEVFGATKIFSCVEIGDFYRVAVSKTICSSMTWYTLVGGIVSILIGIGLFILYPVILSIVIRNPENDFIHKPIDRVYA